MMSGSILHGVGIAGLKGELTLLTLANLAGLCFPIAGEVFSSSDTEAFSAQEAVVEVLGCCSLIDCSPCL
jgi:hypothetical protein